MSLLFDQNLSYRLCRLVASAFPHTMQVRLAGLDAADDRSIWEFAKRNDLILVSFDWDFAEMAALFGPPPKVVWLRCGNQPTSEIAAILLSRADAIKDFASNPDDACLEIYGGTITPSR